MDPRYCTELELKQAEIRSYVARTYRVKRATRIEKDGEWFHAVDDSAPHKVNTLGEKHWVLHLREGGLEPRWQVEKEYTSFEGAVAHITDVEHTLLNKLERNHLSEPDV